MFTFKFSICNNVQGIKNMEREEKKREALQKKAEEEQEMRAKMSPKNGSGRKSKPDLSKF